MEPVVFEKDGPVGWLTLNRPEKRNALSIEVLNDMLSKLNLLATDEDIRVVVIRGSGPAFCAGHDLNEMVGAHYDAHHFHNIFSKYFNLYPFSGRCNFCNAGACRKNEDQRPVCFQHRG